MGPVVFSTLTLLFPHVAHQFLLFSPIHFGFFKTFSTTLGFFPSLCFCRELHSHSEKLTSPFKTIFFSKNHLCVTSLKFSPQTHFCKRFQEEYLVYVGLQHLSLYLDCILETNLSSWLLVLMVERPQSAEVSGRSSSLQSWTGYSV